jgi:Mn-dependent DtxR family transcriptional regulator
VIASRLNLSPETLSRIFAELSRAGLIDVDGRAVKISAVTQLREYGL